MRVVSELRGDGTSAAIGPDEGTCANVIDTAVAERWGPSRMPPAASWSREGRAPRPRQAQTHIQVCRRGTCALAGPLIGRRVSVVKLRPSTGRRHQLRATLAHLGYPIVGDVAYAGDLSSYRLMLHASALTFHCPTDPQRPLVAVEGAGGHAATADGSGRRARARRKRALAEGLEDSAADSVRALRALDGQRIVAGGDPFEGVLET